MNIIIFKVEVNWADIKSRVKVEKEKEAKMTGK